jgi:AraC-like DNA-binding protein
VVSSSDFTLDGIMTPGRVCRIVTPALLRDWQAAKAAGQVVDTQVAAWIRAVVQAGEDWAACVDARKSDADRRPPAHSACDLLTVADVATRFGCSATNVRRLITEGQLTPVRRQPYLIYRAEVERFSAARDERKA